METARNNRPPLEERLIKGLEELNEWARGERNDLRTTTVTVPDDEPNPPIPTAPNKKPAHRRPKT